MQFYYQYDSIQEILHYYIQSSFIEFYFPQLFIFDVSIIFCHFMIHVFRLHSFHDFLESAIIPVRLIRLQKYNRFKS